MGDKNVKEPIKDLVKEMNSNHKKLQQQRGRKQPDELAIQDAQRKFRASEKQFYADVAAFEPHRVESMKTVLTEFCNSLLYFHSRRSSSSQQHWQHCSR